MLLAGKTILITGGSSGIGLELARQLGERGNTVIVTGRDERKLERARQLAPGLHTFVSDASDAGAVRSLHDTMTAQFPALNVVVNNAGIMRNLKLDQPRPGADLTREIDIALNGPLWLIQQFLPHLLRQPEALIVNVSSGLAFVPFPAAPIYCAAKAGLHAYTQCLRAQLAGSSVAVVELAPPGTETPLFRNEFATEMKREKGMDTATLVQRAIKGIEAGQHEIRPGLSNVLKIASRVAPDFMFKQMVKLSQLKPIVPAAR
jgi:uncharacterized oxidoreductase